MIHIQGLTKQYGGGKVLDGVNLSFESDKTYGIVGANGAGKTTLFKCIAGLEEYEGTITSEHEKLKNHLGFLPTDPYYLSRMTGREYIQLICTARKNSFTDIDDRNVFDLPLDQYASTYSTGMKKKLGLLAILIQGFEIFILDEPFNGVDLHGNLLITEIIRKLKTLGKTILISSHILSTLTDTCDEIYILEQGSAVRKVEREQFPDLAQAMKEVSIGNEIERLKLR
jgi:ABC-2 type transport system ATP-binding protein